MKNFKIFCQVQIASYPKEIIQASTRYELPTSLEQLYSYGDIQKYTNICFESALRMQF